jgi:hypothetical protein
MFWEKLSVHLRGSSNPRPFRLVNNHQSTLRNITEERRSHLHRGGSLNSRNCLAPFEINGDHTSHQINTLKQNTYYMLMPPAATSKLREFCSPNVRSCGLLTLVKLESHYFLYINNQVDLQLIMNSAT